MGNIESAYDISYTTRVTRPDGGGALLVNNSARIILDDEETSVNDEVDTSWSSDLPVINKEGALAEDPHKINWEVEYNYGQEVLGEVTLADTLNHGAVDLETVTVLEVNVDIDGNVIGEGTPVEITPEQTEAGMILPNLDADGKAYLITFSSIVPVGLNETIINNITDDLENPNSDEASVDVNTVPTGGKIGEQLVDEEGQPYIEWTLTMNTEKIDVGSIKIKDVFNPKHLIFDNEDTSSYELYRDGEEVDHFTIKDYQHEDGREGFALEITDVGPSTYEFKYRTYYTAVGMQEPDLANEAELIFEDEGGIGIGDPVVIDFEQTGPKVGIHKTGQYVTNEERTEQQILWTININESEILLENPTITDAFTSGNYEYIEDSISVLENGEAFTDYEFSQTENGWTIDIDQATNAKYTITYQTTTDDEKNLEHKNEAILTWQGGAEEAEATVGQRDPKVDKTGEVVVNEDGTKSVRWLVDFNTSEHVIHDFVLEDTYEPTSVTVSDIKIMSDGDDVTDQFTISPERTGGHFTVSKDKLDAVSYQLSYTTTLSPAEEQKDIKNAAKITYTGGEDDAEETIPRPTLGVEKQANEINKEADRPTISWTIQANTDSGNHHVQLVDAVLADTIPEDQKLLAESIEIERVNGGEVELDLIDSSEHSFEIALPDGPYQYTVTFDTEILQMPSMDTEVFDRYNNSTVLTNQLNHEDLEQTAEADASIRYYEGIENDLTGKTGEQNAETENIDYEVMINPEGLTIHQAKISDCLSENHQYVEGSIQLLDAEGKEVEEGFDLEIAEDNRSFEIVFTDDTINETYQVSYGTRLNPSLIGTQDVFNDIMLTGGAEETELHKTETSTDAQQWFYGGGGSGRLLDFNIAKETPSEVALSGAQFKLERVDLNGATTVVDENIVTENELYKILNQRAGRYILTEIGAPEGFKTLEAPIYFAAGYTETADEYSLTLMDSNWNEATHPNATVEGNTLTVVNHYEPVSATLTAHKRLEGNKALEADQFTFELLNAEGELLQTAKNDAEGNITFDALSFETPGEYTYGIREVAGDFEGMTYDPTIHSVTITVSNDESGKLALNVDYEEGEADFINEYQAAETEIELTADKVLAGQELSAEQFKFEVIAADGEKVATGTNDENGHVSFEPIKLTEKGIYEYTIREVKGDQRGVDYDASEYEIVVEVMDDLEGQLHAKVDEINGPAVFTNTYTPSPDSVVFEASKVLEGQELREDQFNFELLDENGTVIQTVTNHANGQVIFDAITYEEVGEHTYTIREKAGDQGGIDYDDTEYPVTVNVIDDGKGQLHAETDQGEGPAVFTNTYEATPDSVVFEASKVLEG